MIIPSKSESIYGWKNFLKKIPPLYEFDFVNTITSPITPFIVPPGTHSLSYTRLHEPSITGIRDKIQVTSPIVSRGYMRRCSTRSPFRILIPGGRGSRNPFIPFRLHVRRFPPKFQEVTFTHDLSQYAVGSSRACTKKWTRLSPFFSKNGEPLFGIVSG